MGDLETLPPEQNLDLLFGETNHGEWHRAGNAADGPWVRNRSLPPLPITVSGLYGTDSPDEDNISLPIEGAVHLSDTIEDFRFLPTFTERIPSRPPGNRHQTARTITAETIVDRGTDVVRHGGEFLGLIEVSGAIGPVSFSMYPNKRLNRSSEGYHLANPHDEGPFSYLMQQLFALKHVDTRP